MYQSRMRTQKGLHPAPTYWYTKRLHEAGRSWLYRKSKLGKSQMKNDQLLSVLKQPLEPNNLSEDFRSLSIENQETVRKIQTEINQTKFSVGDIDFQLAQLELKKTELIQKIHTDMLNLNKTLTDIACELGIDPKMEKWNIDLTATELGFKRVG